MFGKIATCALNKSLRDDPFRDTLDNAISCGNYATVKSFLDRGAMLNLDISNTKSCLNIVILNKDIKTLYVLLNHIIYRTENATCLYDKKVSSLLTTSDISKKSPIRTAIDMFLSSSSFDDKKFFKQCIKLIYNNPLFDKNNSELFNTNWKTTSNYFLEYNQSLLKSVENYVLDTKDRELIQFFIENGLNYVDSAILCVNPSFYSHSAIIIKFNKPIKFRDSLENVAGILYSFALKGKTDNSKITFWDRNLHSLEQIKSFILSCNAYMHRIFLTSHDFSKMDKFSGNSIFDCSLVESSYVHESVSSTFNILKNLRKVPDSSWIRLNPLLKEFTSNVEKMSYLFSLYNSNAINFASKDKISDYSFDSGCLVLNLNNTGKSVYEFIWEKPKRLNLSHDQKLDIIEKFLNMECLKVLKENSILSVDSITFSLDDFYKLPRTYPNDLHEKFYYPKTLKLDLNFDPSTSALRDAATVAQCGYKMMSMLENFNIHLETYSFFRKNCVTTLKQILSECGYKDHIDQLDKNLNIFQKIHPLTVVTRLQRLIKKKSKNLIKGKDMV